MTEDEMQDRICELEADLEASNDMYDELKDLADGYQERITKLEGALGDIEAITRQHI